MFARMTRFALDRPKTVIGLALLLTVLFGLQFPKMTIDTDPENMLESDQPDRVLYDRVKQAFGIHDLIVVGIGDQQGICRPEALQRVARAIAEILTIKGVIDHGAGSDQPDARREAEAGTSPLWKPIHWWGKFLGSRYRHAYKSGPA